MYKREGGGEPAVFTTIQKCLWKNRKKNFGKSDNKLVLSKKKESFMQEEFIQAIVGRRASKHKAVESILGPRFMWCCWESKEVIFKKK
jgi:hypothetical protein